ncbi:MAG: hypothetical protein AAF675_15445, partial [Pseudomonadota bacterium]
MAGIDRRVDHRDGRPAVTGGYGRAAQPHGCCGPALLAHTPPCVGAVDVVLVKEAGRHEVGGDLHGLRGVDAERQRQSQDLTTEPGQRALVDDAETRVVQSLELRCAEGRDRQAYDLVIERIAAVPAFIVVAEEIGDGIDQTETLFVVVIVVIVVILVIIGVVIITVILAGVVPVICVVPVISIISIIPIIPVAICAFTIAIAIAVAIAAVAIAAIAAVAIAAVAIAAITAVAVAAVTAITA